MSRLLFVVSAIILVVIGLISVGLLLWKRSGSGDGIIIKNTTSAETTNTAPGGANANGDVPATTPLAPPVPVRSEESVTLDNFVRSFVERYGSYSTDAPFENLRRTFADMTDSFRKQEEKKIKSSRGTSEFYGVIVHVQSMKILEQTAERVRVSVTTQWEEERGTKAAQLSRHTIELLLLSSGKGWKVDRATWK